MAVLDRYLSTVTVKIKELQLVGLASLLLASKYEDFWHPRVIIGFSICFPSILGVEYKSYILCLV